MTDAITHATDLYLPMIRWTLYDTPLDVFVSTWNVRHTCHKPIVFLLLVLLMGFDRLVLLILLILLVLLVILVILIWNNPETGVVRCQDEYKKNLTKELKTTEFFIGHVYI